jgi:hypothetical protein
MPTGAESVIRGLISQGGLRGREQMYAQSLALKLQQQQDLEDYRNLLDQNAKQRIGLAGQRLNDTEQQNIAFSNYVMGIDENDPAVPPDMKMQLQQMKSYIAGHPGIASSGIAKAFLPKVKAAGWQLVPTATMDADGNPITTYEVLDKTKGTLGPTPAGAGTFGPAVAPAGPAPAPAKKSPGDALIDEYLGGP